MDSRQRSRHELHSFVQSQGGLEVGQAAKAAGADRALSLAVFEHGLHKVHMKMTNEAANCAKI